LSASRLSVLLKAVVVCGAVVGIDQLSKGLIRENIARGDTVQVLPFLDFANTRNRGIAFGLAGDVSPVIIAVALVLLIGLLGFLSLRRNADPLVWLPAGLLVGGAIGNLADRVRDEAVTDFIDFPAWPTFNLADVAIVVGLFLLVLLPEIRARSSGDGG
jgi:signal peptidase II